MRACDEDSVSMCYLRERREQLSQDADGALVALAEIGARGAQVQCRQRFLEHTEVTN